jgi:hypothetical protein
MLAANQLSSVQRTRKTGRFLFTKPTLYYDAGDRTAVCPDDAVSRAPAFDECFSLVKELQSCPI